MMTINILKVQIMFYFDDECFLHYSAAGMTCFCRLTNEILDQTCFSLKNGEDDDIINGCNLLRKGHIEPT